MKTLNLLIIFTFLNLSIISCKKDNDGNDEIVNQKRPGNFVLTELRNSNLKNKKSKSTIISSKSKSTIISSNSEFDLGDLKASREFYFLLTNSGDEAIFDIELVTDKDGFIIAPSHIEQLSSNTTMNYEESTGIIPLLSLGIIHGIQLNGVGYSDLLPLNINTSTLTISGKTINNSDTITITSEFDFLVNSKIMDIKLFSDVTEIDLTDSPGAASMNLGGLGFNRVYEVNSTNISIENIGNVVINVNYGYDLKHDMFDVITINPNETKQLIDFAGWSIIVLDSNGTITDDERIQLGNDGKGYFIIQMGSN